MNQYREGKVKSTPTRGVKQYLKPDAYNQSELDWTPMTIHPLGDGSHRRRRMSGIVTIDGWSAAVASLLAALADMGLNHCASPGGCLAVSRPQAHLGATAGETHADARRLGAEVQIRHDMPLAAGPFQAAWGVSGSSERELWIGGGYAHTIPAGGRAFVQTHVMAGLHDPGDGRDLGGSVQFRSGIELGWRLRRGARMSLGFDHRSNAGLRAPNPGIETTYLRLSLPIR